MKAEVFRCGGTKFLPKKPADVYLKLIPDNVSEIITSHQISLTNRRCFRIERRR